MKKIEVKWRDSNIYPGQRHIEDDFKVYRINSVGYLVTEDSKQVVVTRDDLENGEIRDVIVIPRENIVEISDLNEKKGE